MDINIAQSELDNPTHRSRAPDDNAGLAMVPVVISANGIDYVMSAFLDPATSLNIIREDVAEMLKCKGRVKRVSFGTFHGVDPEFDSMKISVIIKLLDRPF
jgi:hypothetical protein